MAKCKKCGQIIVRLEDGTPDCGCFVEADQNYPSLAKAEGKEEIDVLSV